PRTHPGAGTRPGGQQHGSTLAIGRHHSGATMDQPLNQSWIDSGHGAPPGFGRTDNRRLGNQGTQPIQAVDAGLG
ncbi:MAG: hypothetical protein P8Q20_01250, partial [Acidimicrobiales bacterium]|nr:hypothetical protein [Acidimicrobiales bacterium]